MVIEKFSSEEQASLVWQFLCSIPVKMIAEFLPWLASYVSSDEYQDMLRCLCTIVPEEKLLQQVSFRLHAINGFFYQDNVSTSTCSM